MNDNHDDQDRRIASSEMPGGSVGRRPYAKPVLTEYGSIAKLTQGTRTTQADGGAGGGFKMTCL